MRQLAHLEHIKFESVIKAFWMTSMPRKLFRNFLGDMLILFRFRDSPRETIVYYGRQLGRYSYCGRELSDERSLKVGYGKRCAESNSEQWGN